MLARRLLLGAAFLFAFALAGGCADDTVPTPAVDGGGSDLGGGMLDLGALDSGRDVDAGEGIDAGDTIDGGALVDGGGSTDGGGGRPDGAACMPTVNNTSNIGDTCSPDGVPCAAGYVCFGFSGVVLSYSCEIACIDDCDCAGATACATVNDKAGPHLFCRVP